MKTAYFLAILILLVTSCRKDPAILQPDTFSFGLAYGFCAGDCAYFYQLKDMAVYRDNIDHYKNIVSYEPQPLSQSKYQIAKNMLDSLPAFLNQHQGQTIGCPDCYDQGGFHISHVSKGITRRWYIDTSADSQPVEIRDYMKRMKEVIEELNQ